MNEIDGLQTKQVEEKKMKDEIKQQMKEDIKKPTIEQIPEVEEEERQVKQGDPIQTEEGGNTSVEEGMGDTPSNYDELNQRYHDDVRNRARIMDGEALAEEDYEEDEDENGMRTKKRRKGRKKKRKDEGDVTDRDLLMARAYGGLTQTQLQRLIEERQRKEDMRSGSKSQLRPSRMRKQSDMMSDSQFNDLQQEF